jgi:hypothetical protein
MDIDSYDSYMAAQKARIAAISERAEATLARLGGGTSSSTSRQLSDGLTADELERDALSIRRVLRVWTQTRKHATNVSTIQLPSGKVLTKDWSDDGTGGLERAVARRPRHLKKGR